MTDSILFSNTQKNYPTPKSIPYREMATSYLGKDYELSVVFCGEKLMRTINKATRGKDYATNVLSFPLSEKSGEMFICLPVCKKECKEFERTYENFVGFLFIHGLVHLNGYDHGATMDKEELKLQKRFSI